MSARGLSPLLAYGLLTGSAMFWGSNHVVGRGVAESVPIAALCFWRWALAWLLLLPVCWPHFRRDLPVLLRHKRWLFALGCMGFAAFTYLIYLGAFNTLAVNVGLINATTPVWILLIAVATGTGRPGAGQWLGVLISLAGVTGIVARGDPAALLDMQFASGDLWALAATIVWAVYSIMLGQTPRGVHAFSVLLAGTTIGLIVLAPVMAHSVLVLGEPWFSRLADPSADLLKIGYIALGPAFLGYLCWNKGVDTVGPATASVFLYLIPVCSSALAILLLGETFRWFHAVGGALIVLGIWLTTRKAA